ncbi:hypothetical protein [Actinomadura sp. WMMA1423]|uniref:phosphatase domain-containing protein n=1 Tax=Actinomadura sp. WMMA1423 TaxID=2591108 RepID=UPI00197ABE4F|nr:hypothetical protein [Actinomadura sp. WMMA1423]
MPEHNHEFARRIQLALLTRADNIDVQRLADVTSLSPRVAADALERLEIDDLVEGRWHEGVRYYHLTPEGLRQAHDDLGLHPAAAGRTALTKFTASTRMTLNELMADALGIQLAEPAAPGQLYLVDVDGTVALRDETRPDVRSPFDWARVGEDLPNRPVISIVQALDAAGHRIIYVSGRSCECRTSTGAWLAEHVGVPGEALLMRTAGDYRRDTIVKRELYERFVVPKRVTAVLDDRASVVAMWRELGLTVLQCAEGAF